MALLDAYAWEFCQIQYNYLDENSQAGRTGLKYAASKGISVIIMEPLRGGMLTRLPEEANKKMESFPVKRTPAEWGFTWLWSQPEVTCVLSGMNSMEMLQENVKRACEVKPEDMGEAEQKLLKDVVTCIRAKMKVGCPGCRYCQPCPKGVDIPGIFSAYNNYYSVSRFHALREYFMCCYLRKAGTGIPNCIGCGACEKVCPQHIGIRKKLENAGKVLESPPLGVLYKASRLVMKY